MEIIYAIPGLGTTKELFNNLFIPRHRIRVLLWPPTRSGLDLREYAKLFIEQIDTSQPANLIGVSFGGMLCVELSSMIKTNKVVLISSCKSRKEFPPLFAITKALGIYHLLSDESIRRFAKKFSWVLGFDKSFRPAFYKMIDSMPSNYFLHSLSYILGWKRKTCEKSVYHIHGTSDRLLPHRYIENFIPVKNGSHAMVIDQAAEINAILGPIFDEQ